MNLVILVVTFSSILLDIGILLQIYAENKKFFKEPKGGNYHGKISVIIPIRGLDTNLEENVRSILNQDIKPLEIIYVIDPDDPYRETIENILKKYDVKITHTFYNCTLCSGKIRAQLSGLLRSNGNIIVFGDSDTWYPKYWLRELTLPLSKYMATTTFSFASPAKLTLRNLIRAGFWTLGIESQALGGTFLWGGSMAFKRSFFNEDIIKCLSNEWCDDCTLTKIVKERKGKIGFIGNAIPLNVYDEYNLFKWAQRQVLTVKIYSYRGAKAFLVFGLYISFLLVFLILTGIPLLFLPFLLWIIKNLLRGRRLGKKAIFPSLFSIIGIYFAWIVLILSWRKKKVLWRDKVYTIENKQ
ncbi:glycosyltransferase family 2 protein [Acidianus sp. HS-5]|uniref:glycosyltransferase n=1 Tax=Acidianus sp. HS-5 TaxID=2886040 RepID=UPI001F1D4D37|nr:glycosyltransferase family 2 protein [Acidianus sp. HS-5]BDC18383.1 glycosyl transferase family 2 [Acidianus sp. HS-5]